MTQTYRTLRVAPADPGVLSVVIDAPPMNLIGPEARTADLFSQGLQTRGPLELDLGERLGSL